MKTAATISVCVVDDEPPAREGIAALLAGDPEVQVVDVCECGSAAVAAVIKSRPDVMFLDVQMPDMTGFDVIRAIGRTNMPVTVFTTAFDQYALRAFQVYAIDYLLKPFTDERFLEALATAKGAVRQGRLAKVGERMARLIDGLDLDGGRPVVLTGETVGRIGIRNDGKTFFVPVKEIDWIEGADYYSRIHAGGKSHLIRETLASLAKRLDPRAFFRAHRSAIVNVDKVSTIHPMFNRESVAVLIDGTQIKLARGKRAALEALLESRP